MREGPKVRKAKEKNDKIKDGSTRTAGNDKQDIRLYHLTFHNHTSSYLVSAYPQQ